MPGDTVEDVEHRRLPVDDEHPDPERPPFLGGHTGEPAAQRVLFDLGAGKGTPRGDGQDRRNRPRDVQAHRQCAGIRNADPSSDMPRIFPVFTSSHAHGFHFTAW